MQKKPNPENSSLPTVPLEERMALATLCHHDPHSILGAHPLPQGLVVRAFRPDAEKMWVTVEGQAPVAMQEGHPDGIFEVLLPQYKAVKPYQFKVRLQSGNEFSLRDPYAFLPSLGELDQHLFNEGRHEQLHEKMGARVMTMNGVEGVSFTVWAPSAKGVSVVGDFNSWDGRMDAMRCLGSSGIWELFVPDLRHGTRYKYEIRAQDGSIFLKADPYATWTEEPPLTASRVFKSSYPFKDEAWLKHRAKVELRSKPVSIYEVHLGSWRCVPEKGNRPLTYRELADELVDYVVDMGFTHVELLPVMEHPFGPSWGYQVSSYFAPSARWGDPDDFKALIDAFHQRGVGVFIDWVPAHFPRDAFALARFDGTALYEHEDPRKGAHPDWGTLIFNYGRHEVKNFLMASALYWLEQFHTDGLRLDAVASMLYLDYSRKEGEWIPNQFGGRENLEAIALLKEMNAVAYGRCPGVTTIAEESTAWPAVSRPTYLGGLGFGFKWDMGWMNDTLRYFSKDPVYRRYHHQDLTFGYLYAWTENFVLPLSHDEVVHGKGSLLSKMPGDRWQQLANLRSLYGYMWARPGKKLLFMGAEFGQDNEWNHAQSLDWHLCQWWEHKGIQNLVRDLNRLYAQERALWELDCEPRGFTWIDANNADNNLIAFIRHAATSEKFIVCVCNFSPSTHFNYRVGLPGPAGNWDEILNTDSYHYGGSNQGNGAGIGAQDIPWNNQPCSAEITVPPLGVVWLKGPY